MPQAQVKIVQGPVLINGVPTIWVQVGQDRNLRAITLGETQLFHLLEYTTTCLKNLHIRREMGRKKEK